MRITIHTTSVATGAAIAATQETTATTTTANHPNRSANRHALCRRTKRHAHSGK